MEANESTRVAHLKCHASTVTFRRIRGSYVPSALLPPRHSRLLTSKPVTWADIQGGSVLGGGDPLIPRPHRVHFPWSATLLSLGGIRRPRLGFCKSPAQRAFRGAGGNRTPVHQALTVRATTVPDIFPDAGRPAGQLGRRLPGGPRTVFPAGHSSFRTSADLCRRHPSLLLPGCDGLAPCVIADHDDSASPEDQAVRAKLLFSTVMFLPRLASLSNSGRTLGQQL
jgi:hypothetical protein